MVMRLSLQSLPELLYQRLETATICGPALQSGKRCAFLSRKAGGYDGLQMQEERSMRRVHGFFSPRYAASVMAAMLCMAGPAAAQAPAIDWKKQEAEILKHH